MCWNCIKDLLAKKKIKKKSHNSVWSNEKQIFVFGWVSSISLTILKKYKKPIFIEQQNIHIQEQ